MKNPWRWLRDRLRSRVTKLPSGDSASDQRITTQVAGHEQPMLPHDDRPKH